MSDDGSVMALDNKYLDPLGRYNSTANARDGNPRTNEDGEIQTLNDDGSHGANNDECGCCFCHPGCCSTIHHGEYRGYRWTRSNFQSVDFEFETPGVGTCTTHPRCGGQGIHPSSLLTNNLAEEPPVEETCHEKPNVASSNISTMKRYFNPCKCDEVVPRLCIGHITSSDSRDPETLASKPYDSHNSGAVIWATPGLPDPEPFSNNTNQRRITEWDNAGGIVNPMELAGKMVSFQLGGQIASPDVLPFGNVLAACVSSGEVAIGTGGVQEFSSQPGIPFSNGGFSIRAWATAAITWRRLSFGAFQTRIGSVGVRFAIGGDLGGGETKTISLSVGGQSQLATGQLSFAIGNFRLVDDPDGKCIGELDYNFQMAGSITHGGYGPPIVDPGTVSDSGTGAGVVRFNMRTPNNTGVTACGDHFTVRGKALNSVGYDVIRFSPDADNGLAMVSTVDFGSVGSGNVETERKCSSSGPIDTDEPVDEMTISSIIANQIATFA